MEYSETTDKPDCYETVNEKNNWQDLSGHGLLQGHTILVMCKNVQQGKGEYIDAQKSRRWYEQEEEPIVTLQSFQNIILLDPRNSVQKIINIPFNL